MSLRTRNKTAGEPTEFVELKDTGDKAPVAKPVAVRRSGITPYILKSNCPISTASLI